MAKKMVITLGSIATIIAIPAIAISCGDNSSKTNELSVTKHSHGDKGNRKGDKLLTVAEYQQKIDDIKGKDAIWGKQILKLWTHIPLMPLVDPVTKRNYTRKERIINLREFGKKEGINPGIIDNFINDYYYNKRNTTQFSLISEWQVYVKETIQAYENKIKIVKKHEKFEKWVKSRT